MNKNFANVLIVLIIAITAVTFCYLGNEHQKARDNYELQKRGCQPNGQ